MVVYPPGVMPDLDHLVQGVKRNPHGFGASVGTRTVIHSLDAQAVIDHFVPARLAHPGEPAIFHARHATGSPHTLANCQPLMLDDGTLLAHNGALFPVHGSQSDTRVFAEDFLPRWDLDNADDRRRLSELLGHNKMFILRPGKVPVLLGGKYGVWMADGSWHSSRDGSGENHLAAGQCSSCAVAVENGPPASMCEGCQVSYEMRRTRLWGELRWR